LETWAIASTDPPYKEIPPTGKSFEVDFCTVAVGTITKSSRNLFYDLVTFIGQIGLSDSS
jgi:hypothetical protein